MTTTPSVSPGITIEAGDHICAFYRGSNQRDDVLLPFLRDGLIAGHKCISVLDGCELSDVSTPLSIDIDVTDALATGQLKVEFR